MAHQAYVRERYARPSPRLGRNFQIRMIRIVKTNDASLQRLGQPGHVFSETNLSVEVSTDDKKQ